MRTGGGLNVRGPADRALAGNPGTRQEGDAGPQGDAGSTSLGRGLAILREISAAPPYVSLRELHDRTGLPKPSIVRLLARLVAEGYVAAVPKRGCYRLSAGIGELSRGFDPAWTVVDVVERMPDLLAGYKWPIAIGTRAGASLLVLFDNRQPDSPYSFRPSTFGTRLPLLTTGMGAAFLAYCDDGERRRAALDLAIAQSSLGHPLEEVERVAAVTRERGYGLRLGGKGESTTVALPVFGRRGELAAVLAQGAFAAATTAEDIRTVSRDLAATAALISAHLRSRSG